MELQTKASETGFTISGLYKDVQQNLAAADSDLALLFAGIVMALHYGNNGRMEANFNAGNAPADDRPVELSVELGSDHQPETLSFRFLDEESQP